MLSPVTTELFRPTSELLDELKAASEQLESADPDTIIQWAVERFGEYLTMGTAFGPEGMTILARLSKLSPDTHVFNLDTGYQFQETLDLRDEVERRYGIQRGDDEAGTDGGAVRSQAWWSGL